MVKLVNRPDSTSIGGSLGWDGETGSMMSPEVPELRVALPPEKGKHGGYREELSPFSDDFRSRKTKKEYYYDMSIFKRWFERKRKSRSAAKLAHARSG